VDVPDKSQVGRCSESASKACVRVAAGFLKSCDSSITSLATGSRSYLKTASRNRTSDAFTGILKANSIQISMDGKGRWMDNVFIERLWRSVKYEHVYLYAYDTIAELRAGLRTYFDTFNQDRTHQGLARQTPNEVYFATELRKAA